MTTALKNTLCSVRHMLQIATTYVSSLRIPAPSPQQLSQLQSLSVMTLSATSTTCIIKDNTKQYHYHHSRSSSSSSSSSSSNRRSSSSIASESWQPKPISEVLRNDGKDAFEYRLAVARHVPKSFVTDSVREHEPSIAIDYQLAKKQHRHYTDLLQQNLDLDVSVLPAIESLPDCCFVEDTVVVVGDKAVLLRMGHHSRREETHTMGEWLRSRHINVTDMNEQADPSATVDGGDVLFTGTHLIVGLSKRTNQQGVDVLRSVFERSGLPVLVAPVHEGLHLKSVMSMAGPDRILYADIPAAEAMCDSIDDALRSSDSQKSFQFVPIPDFAAANTVCANGALLLRSAEEYPRSAGVLATTCIRADLTVVPITYSEFEKADGALTCCSVLLH
jgi:dimethylargininase